MILVGPGWWGKRWVRAIQERAGCELVGLVARTCETLETVCKEFGFDPAKCFTDHRDAFSRLRADAALVLVPPALHKDVAEAALEAGLHVLEEKPIAAAWEDAVSIYESWRKAGKPCFMVAQTRRWSDHIFTLKRFIESGGLGKVGFMNVQYRTHRLLTGWRCDLRYPLLEDMSTHHFENIRYLTGADAVTIFCHSFRTPWDWFSGDTGATVAVEMTGHVQASYFGCWTTQGRETSPEGDITIVGEKGTVELLGVDKISFYPQDGQPEQLPLEKIPRSYIEYALDEFCCALREDRQPECNIVDNLRTFAMTAAAIESWRQGKRIQVSDLLSRIETETQKGC